MTLITDEYRALNEKLHESNPAFGVSGQNYVPYVMDLVKDLRTQDVLDYGCGKSTLANNIPFKINQYDPCIPKYSAAPNPADIVVCTDVLEHIEPECLDDVLDDLKRVVKKVGFFSIANGPAKKTLADGRNAHLIQQPARWWLDKIFQRFDLMCFNSMSLGEDAEHGMLEEYILIVRAIA